MKVRLLIRNKFDGEAGEIVEVSPAEFQFLTSLGQAVPVSADNKQVKAEVTKTTKATKAKK